MKLLMWLISLFCLSLCSCYDDEIDVVGTEDPSGIRFGIADAREFFENNATDLAPLSFAPAGTKSAGRASVDLHPQWEKAMQSGHRGVSLVEVPLGATTVAMVREHAVWGGTPLGCRSVISGRRLVVAKRASGEVEMFVATIVPKTVKRHEELVRMVEDFRYLGGSSFTGRVFCSTLEGKFVKAFGYTEGELNGRLSTRVRNTPEEMAAATGTYTRVTFTEIPTVTASMFWGDESGGGWNGGGSGIGGDGGGGDGGGGGDWGDSGGDSGGGIDYGRCPHGYTKGFCPYGCDAEIGGVDIVVCPDCHTQNGCVCAFCPDCGEKEKNCNCARCGGCGNKLPECNCFVYPDPDKPGGGGGSDGEGTGQPEQPETPEKVTAENFQDLIVTPEFKKMIKEELGVDPDNIPIEVVEAPEREFASAKYLDGKLMVYAHLFERDYALKDIESILYHEYVHAKQTLIDNIVVPTDAEGKPIMKEYVIPYDKYDLEDAWERLEMSLSNIPHDEQERVYQDLKAKIVDPIQDLIAQGATKTVTANKELVMTELEANEKQLNKYGNEMTEPNCGHVKRNIKYCRRDWERIKNL